MTNFAKTLTLMSDIGNICKLSRAAGRAQRLKEAYKTGLKKLQKTFEKRLTNKSVYDMLVRLSQEAANESQNLKLMSEQLLKKTSKKF